LAFRKVAAAARPKIVYKSRAMVPKPTSYLLRLSWIFLILAPAGACGNDAGAGASPDGGGERDAAVSDASSDGGAGPNDGSVDGAAGRDGGSDAGTTGTRSDAGSLAPRRFLCINGAGVDGAGGRGSGGNPDFETLCARLGSGLIQDCASGTCYSTFAFETSGNPSRDALVKALDSNKDGRVTSADDAARLVIVGYSWGGTNVRDLALWMTSEPRFDDARRRVEFLLALDPYRPGGTMDIPANVEQFVEYRHSVAPANDCSRITLGGIPVSGPYLGIVPRCKSGTVCTDYDYTLGGSTFYPGGFTPGRGYTGANVDHCGLVNVAASAIPPLLAASAFSPLPPKVPVANY
jgi:hypothetical protein